MTLKCRLYRGDGKYGSIRDELNLYVGPCKFTTNCYPHQITFGECELYVFSTRESCREALELVHETMPKTLKSNPNVIFAAWDQGSMDRLTRHTPQVLRRPNLINLDHPNWVNILLSALKGAKRRRDNE